MKYKVNDRVRIKDTDIEGTIESIIRGQFIVDIKDSKIPVWPEDIVLMKSVEEETVHNKWTGLKVELELSKTVIGVSNVESLRGERFMSGFVKAIIPPEGYIFKDENGNEILTSKIILEKKKKEYPKTYEECCKILGLLNVDLCFNADYRSFDASKEQWKRLGLMNQFYQLLICCDAYWKIAGEEMGLGKPWEPDWKDDTTHKFTIHTIKDKIYRGVSLVKNYTFAFPTEEMRDAFKENFDPDIEICKELL